MIQKKTTTQKRGTTIMLVHIQTHIHTYTHTYLNQKSIFQYQEENKSMKKGETLKDTFIPIKHAQVGGEKKKDANSIQTTRMINLAFTSTRKHSLSRSYKREKKFKHPFSL